MNELTPERERMLGDCLLLLDGGASLEDCLARYPDAADDLRPFLEVRVSLTRTVQLEPPPGAYETGRSRLLAQLEKQLSDQVSVSLWAGMLSFFSGKRLWGGGLGQAAAGVVAVVVLGLGALSVSAAGGFEPAQDALQPARDVLSALRFLSDDEADRQTPDERPPAGDAAGPTDSPAVAEQTREPGRADQAPTVCDRSSDRLCVDEARPTVERDVPATETPQRDTRPTATPVRDAPARPIDRLATPERPVDVAPGDLPRDEKPTATSPRDAEQPDRHLDDAPSDIRDGKPEPTSERREAEPVSNEPPTRS